MSKKQSGASSVGGALGSALKEICYFLTILFCALRACGVINWSWFWVLEYEIQSRDGFNETVIDGYSGFIFKNRFGMVVSAHCINRAIERICRDYNKEEKDKAQAEQREPVLIPRFTVHQLRHTFCTRFCENETNIKVIQEIMGHADISTTMDIYNEATMAKKVESFANLEDKIKIC